MPAIRRSSVSSAHAIDLLFVPPITTLHIVEKAEILLLQSGPDVSFASCGMPYFIGGEITDRGKMSVQTPASLKARLNIDVRVTDEHRYQGQDHHCRR